MIASEENLAARKRTDVFQIFFTFVQMTAPGMIADQHKCIAGMNLFRTDFEKALFMTAPDGVCEQSGCFELCLEMKMQITDSI